MIPRAQGPSEASADGAFARKLAAAIGSALQAPDGTAAAADLLAIGGALADADQARIDLADEAFAASANDLLDELERAYGLPVEPDLGNAARQARLLAKIRAGRAATPDSILLAVRALAPEATITENDPTTVPRTPADAAHPPTPGAARLVFLFAVRISVAHWNDAALRARLDALLDQMQPAHCDHSIHTTDPQAGFLFGFSAFGLDALFTV